MKPRVVSVCSGVGGFDLGMDRAGFETVAFCEADPWRRKVLARHWPGVPTFPDLTTLDPAELPAADVLIGGTPCQDLSAGGKRAGLDGARSGLFFDYIRVRHGRDIRWCVWENVAGALTSNGGMDFALILGALVGAAVDVPPGGWPGAGVVSGPWGGAVWRLLDAQHFGVPQRRRRVFVVARLGGSCPPTVLLETANGGGHSPSSSEAWTLSPVGPSRSVAAPRIAGTLDLARGGADDNDARAGHIVAFRLGGFAAWIEDRRAATLTVHNQKDATTLLASAEVDAHGMRATYGMAGRLDGSACAVDPLPDGRRYAACGDGVVAPVAEWIGRRLIQHV